MEKVPPRPRTQPWISDTEWEVRLQFACAYRLITRQYQDNVLVHPMSLRVLGEGGEPEHLGDGETPSDDMQAREAGRLSEQFLVNPLGLAGEQVHATKLLKVDLTGSPVAPTRYQINPRSFSLHAAIHAAREDAHCVIVLQTPQALAAASTLAGLRMDNIYSANLLGRIGYAVFEAWNEAGYEAFERALGGFDVIMVRHLGIVCLGADVSQAYFLTWLVSQSLALQECVGHKDVDKSWVMTPEQAALHCQYSPYQHPEAAELCYGAALLNEGISAAQVSD